MMRLGMRFESRYEVRSKLTLEQRTERKLSLRLSLLQKLRGEKIVPKGDCPKCNKKLTPREIMKGFNQDPNDYTTKCPKCGERFTPTLFVSGRMAATTMPFYCAMQTLAQLHGKESFTPKELSEKFQAIYRSALVHFGTINAAFQKAGIVYGFQEAFDCQGKTKSFLGKLPDVVIAAYAGISPYLVRQMRRRLGIDRWKAHGDY